MMELSNHWKRLLLNIGKTPTIETFVLSVGFQMAWLLDMLCSTNPRLERGFISFKKMMTEIKLNVLQYVNRLSSFFCL